MFPLVALATSLAGLLPVSPSHSRRTPGCLVHAHRPMRTSPCMNAQEDDDKRWVKPTGNPQLWWLDEWLESPSERAVRERAKRENIEKWGAILRQRDTFDDELPIGSGSTDGSSVSAGTGQAKAAEWKIVAASAALVLGLIAKAAGTW